VVVSIAILAGSFYLFSKRARESVAAPAASEA
jgi:hypothetical protein